jgi:hypothetical protein
MRKSICEFALLAVGSWLPALPAGAQPVERRVDLELAGFFGGGNPLSVYARERGNQWIAAVGSSRVPGTNRYAFNKSYHWVDLSKAPIADGAVKGSVRVHITPDLWIPSKHLGFTVDLELDAAVKGDGALDGSYKVVKVNSDDPSASKLGAGGKVTGTSKAYAPAAHPDPVTFQLNLQGSLVGGKPSYVERCMVVRLGFQGNALASGIAGSMSPKNEVYGLQGFPTQAGAVTIDTDRITGKIAIPTKTLDLTPCEYAFELDGRIMEGMVVGAYRMTVKVEGGEPIVRDGCFDGKWNAGIQVAKAADTRPWWMPVKGFQPVGPGEHPRLLFRKADLPALRKKAETPEGKAIVARLRRTLNGSDGESLPGEGGGRSADDTGAAGAFARGLTIGHVAGYGMLYQLTGDPKFADLGKQAFEKALAGVKDVDSRYSFRRPNGALRAGPSLGWHAVGFDLCYDGWDAAAREKFGRAIAEYNEGAEAADAKSNLDLETLVRGTMPPGSNHFGMQVGGAAMALLAVTGEAFVDQKRIDTLLGLNEHSLMRNLTEGFGDGGFFAEGDGTGSMASQITFVSALQSWKNALGRDYINVERPNARMMTLKWIYLTVVRNGQPDFWPIRGAYGHNVWARAGKSGAGYFAQGIGNVTEEQKAAMKGYYDTFLLNADTQLGCPYDTASRDPNYTVCAFVNWPVGLEAKNPAAVLPLCYRDSLRSFYAWRNRWQDENDIVISVLTKSTEGYMGAKPDGSLQVAAFGKKFKWGQVAGDVKHWWTSPRGDASVLTTADGVSTAVDFTKSSGAEGLLVTTGQAEGRKVKLGPVTLTFKALTAGQEPEVAVDGDKAVIGKQAVTVKDGNLVLAVTAAP